MEPKFVALALAWADTVNAKLVEKTMRLFALLCVLAATTAISHAQEMTVTDTDNNTSRGLDEPSFAVAAILAPVQNKPYQAERSAHTLQKLADGTVILQETHGIMARSSTGQLREDVHSNITGMHGGRLVDRSDTMATVADPATHSIVIWQMGPATKTKTAISMALPNLDGMKTKPPTNSMLAMLGSAPTPDTLHATPPAFKNSSNAADPNPDVVTHEDLGQQSYEGLIVTGKRTTTTIPVGKIGNDRPIIVTQEVWRSSDLGIVVKEIDTDPRTGDRTMELTGITKTDPDAALFHPPADYKVQDMAQMMKALGSLGQPPAAK